MGAPNACSAARTRAAFAARISFCPWFYYKEDLIYIEHGHQYDEYCSFDYLLHPVAPNPQKTLNKKSRIALSVAHAGMRYFANQLPEFVQRQSAGGVPDVLARPCEQGLFLIELVLNLANQFFQNIFQRDHAGGAAVFIHHDGQMQFAFEK